MSIFDTTCVWCGQQFELEAHDNDAESFSQEMRDHKYSCKERPEDEKFRKRVLKVIKGKDLEESRKIIKKILYGETIATPLNSKGSQEANSLNIGKSETLSEFPEFDKSNSPLPLYSQTSSKF